jgi:hypothetical protein
MPMSVFLDDQDTNSPLTDCTIRIYKETNSDLAAEDIEEFEEIDLYKLLSLLKLEKSISPKLQKMVDKLDL